jgi:hypothetical protein
MGSKSHGHGRSKPGQPKELGKLVGGMQYPAVTMAIRGFEQRLGTEPLLAKKIKRLCKMLHVRT